MTCDARMSAGRQCGRKIGHPGKCRSAEAEAKRRTSRQAPGYRAAQRGYAERWYAENADKAKASAAAHFAARSDNEKHAKWDKSNRKRGHRQKALTKLRKAALGSSGKRPWIFGSCYSCGSVILSQREFMYCSLICKRRETMARRRAQSRGVKITPGRRAAVYERDNWICCLCNLPVDRCARVPAGFAATIDHVIPLARGGERGLNNWQTAHFICNSRKRDVLVAT